MLFVFRNYITLTEIQKSLGILHVDLPRDKDLEEQEFKEIIVFWMNSWWIVYSIGKQVAIFISNTSVK